LIFPVAEAIAYITQGMTLEPGDIIMSGTPSGVGLARKPPIWMKNGDVCEIDIEGIGLLSNPIADEASSKRERSSVQGVGCANIGSLADGSRASQFPAMGDVGGSPASGLPNPSPQLTRGGAGRGGMSPSGKRGWRYPRLPSSYVGVASSPERQRQSDHSRSDCTHDRIAAGLAGPRRGLSLWAARRANRRPPQDKDRPNTG
jgi:hypothetical protein